MTQNNSVNKITEDDEISLKDLILKIKEWWNYLLSKWLIILIMGITGGALGLLYAWKQKPMYTATTTFVLESGEKGGGLGQYAGIASMMGVDLGGGGGGIFQGDNLLELYKSRNIITKTLFKQIDSTDKRPLIEKYIEVYDIRKNWENDEKLKSLFFTVGELNKQFSDMKMIRLRDSVISAISESIIKSNLIVKKSDKSSGIIDISIKSINEEFSKRFNEELVMYVNQFYINTKTKKSIDNVNILQHKTDSVRAVMNGAIYSAVSVVDATPNLNPTRQIQRVAPAQKSQFSAETNKTILSSLVQNLEMAKMSLLKETPLIQIIDEPIYPLKKEKFGKLKGVLLGGILFSLISIFYLLFTKILKSIYR